MSNKFQIGDKVVINRKCQRLPTWIRTKLRLHRIRTIGSIFYDRRTQHTRYYLGTNKRSESGEDIYSYTFRAEMLKIYKMKLHTKRLKARGSLGNKDICVGAFGG